MSHITIYINLLKKTFILSTYFQITNTLCQKCYFMLKVLDEYGQINWVTKVRQFLFSNGFGYIWIEQCIILVRFSLL